ncbi:trypsin-like peptidase domain-containing protein [Paraflavitalea sp. CAU 1676]|uniref:trypsin-like peptidase domain-containing protein n=1 Tax=Paraflavitalea sp. CAU 1676 TaxID=3032598 RepID=UPI0023DC8439|nr:trypsin-like peptidase domain-containing protein [Paraflavitalea sp. CAU 1676]MDF2188439.1 trypsin-like peptidase domain-containing protein [Paraflavitalea sp. CAU 1676]
MAFLTSAERDILADAILTTIGYPQSIRKIFLSDVNKLFKGLLWADPSEQVQLDLDLDRLNNTVALSDGSVPFYSWLYYASRYTRSFPAEFEIVQKAMAKVEAQSGKTAPIVHPQAPAQPMIDKIVKERIVHQDDMVSYAWLQAGVKAGEGVARMQVPRYDNGVPAKRGDGSPIVYAGTGWLLTKELIITNYHVIEARNENEPDALPADFMLQGKATIVEFDYNADNVMGVAVAALEVVASDAALDYAILRLKNPVNRFAPARFPHAILVNVTNPQSVNIIQHPFGHAKKVAIRNNHIYESTAPVVRYFTDTEKGSSGSPVFNDNWQVIALHRASQLVEGVQYQGKSVGWINEGTTLIDLFNHLQQHFAAISNEIDNN